MTSELWVRWICPAVVPKSGQDQNHLQIHNNKGEVFPVGQLATLLEHLRYTKRFSYRVEGQFLIIEHPFELGPNVRFRMRSHQLRAESFGCKIEYYRVRRRT